MTAIVVARKRIVLVLSETVLVLVIEMGQSWPNQSSTTFDSTLPFVNRIRRCFEVAERFASPRSRSMASSSSIVPTEHRRGDLTAHDLTSNGMTGRMSVEKKRGGCRLNRPHPPTTIRLFTTERHVLDLLFQGLKTPVARRLAGWEFLQAHKELACDHLHRPEHIGTVDHPVVVRV